MTNGSIGSSRLWIAGVAVALLLIAGCSSGSSSTGTLTVFGFPALSTNANSLSDDGLAFTNSYSKVNNGQVNVFWNCSDGTALLLYVDSFAHLWSTFWNGSTFTTPTELRAADQDFNLENDDNRSRSDDRDPFFVLFHVLWLNTAVQGRNGDALITWVAEEGLDGDTTNGNDRLFGAYYDRSANSYSTPQTLNNNSSATDVTNFGFVSPSLCYSHNFYIRFDSTIRTSSSYWNNQNQPEADLSGEATPNAYIFWRQDQGAGARFYWLEFDQGQVGNALPVQGASGTGLVPAPAGITLGGDVSNEVVVHNHSMVWRGDVTTPGIATSLFLTRFDTGGSLDSILLSSDPALGVITPDADNVIAANVYGDDNGLTSLYTFFVESLSAPDSLMVAKSDIDDPVLSRELMEIDLGATGVDDFADVAPNRQPTWSGTRINRTMSWIGVFWTQDVGGFNHLAANVVQTRTGPAARTLANSVAAAAAAPNQDPALSIPTSDQGPRVSIQSELADGTSRASDGIQSNVNRMNVSIRQRVGATATHNLLHNGVIFSAGGLAAPPTFAFAVTGAAPAGQVDSREMDEQEVVTDAGTANGDPIIYYLAVETVPQVAGGGTGVGNVRLYGFPVGGTAPQLVSTSGAPGRFADVNRIRIKTTPVGGSGANLHVFFTEPPVLGGEFGNIDANGRSLRTRRFNKPGFAGSPMGTPAAVDAAFTSSHSPALGTNPTTLDRGLNQEDTQMPPVFPPRDDEEMGVRRVFATCNGNIVGVYFRTRQDELNEGGHLFYQEYNGTSWLGSPALVDSLRPDSGLFGGEGNAQHVFPPHLASSTNTLSGTIIFYMKPQHGNDNAVGKERRGFIMVHQ